jgi:predicted AAA+ superfamily ATPase
LYGNLFECFIIADFYKQYYNQGLPTPLYFWRDKNGEIEVDCIIQKDSTLIPIEIKSGETYNSQFFSPLIKWNRLEENKKKKIYVVYAGNESFSGKDGVLVPWIEAGSIIKKL